MDHVCKPYFVADVKRILPSESEKSVENQRICRIIRLPIWFLALSAWSGGTDALTGSIRFQKRKLAPVCNTQLASRASQRCTVSGSSILRSPRLAPGQIRDVTAGDHRGASGWNNLGRFWLLADELFSTTQAFCSRWAVWPAPTGKRATPFSQTVCRGADFYRKYLARRTQSAPARFTGTNTDALWYFHPPAEHRTSPGQPEKKTASQRKSPQQSFPHGRSAPECLFRYEIIRCQAMEATELSGSQAFEMAFIECQGLAAWIAADWSHPSAAENASTPHLLGDLVPVLADLVLGEREESVNG